MCNREITLTFRVDALKISELPNPQTLRAAVGLLPGEEDRHPWWLVGVRLAPERRIPLISSCCAREVYFDTVPYCTGCFKDINPPPNSI